MMPNICKTDKQGIHTHDLCTEMFNEQRVIFLDKEINAQTATEIIMQLEYLDRTGSGDITMYVNSPGGVVSDGLAIIDAMNRCRCDIATVCTGTAASMASVICVCGTKGKRSITPMAEMMIHQPLGGVSGQASDIERAAGHITETKKRLMKLISMQTGQTEEQVTADCDRDCYMDARKVVEYGLADMIYGQ